MLLFTDVALATLFRWLDNSDELKYIRIKISYNIEWMLRGDMKDG